MDAIDREIAHRIQQKRDLQRRLFTQRTVVIYGNERWSFGRRSTATRPRRVGDGVYVQHSLENVVAAL